MNIDILALLMLILLIAIPISIITWIVAIDNLLDFVMKIKRTFS
jgi:hypothetical protein